MAAFNAARIHPLDSLAGEMWEISGSVPVLPIGFELKLFDVVVEEEKGGLFRRMGDLVSLCAEGDAKEALRELRASSNPKYEDMGVLERVANNDSELFSRMGIPAEDAQYVVAALTRVHSWMLRLPNHERVSADQKTVAEMLEKFVPVREFSRYFEGRPGAPQMWIVTQLTTAEELELHPRDKNLKNIDLPSLPSSLFRFGDLQVSLEGRVGEGKLGTRRVVLRRREEGDERAQPLTLALSGSIKYTYEKNFRNFWSRKPRWSPRPSEIMVDGRKKRVVKFVARGEWGTITNQRSWQTGHLSNLTKLLLLLLSVLVAFVVRYLSSRTSHHGGKQA